MSNTKVKLQAQNPLILRSHRLMEAFAKSDDERDFYLDRQEGFIIYVDLDKPQEDLDAFEGMLKNTPERFCLIPKLTFYETKKIMEGFVNEKVYDIDTKEKLLDIIQSKEAREHFLEFIYDHHSELEKWQQYYQERSRIRIIEWLRSHNFHFVFEEDLDLAKNMIEKLKRNLFQPKVSNDIASARKVLTAKAKTYYSSEALNPRPKRGRPPKQAVKQEIEPQMTTDIYITVPPSILPLLFTPDISSAFDVTFSSKFESGEELMAHRRSHLMNDLDLNVTDLSSKLETLRHLSNRWVEAEEVKNKTAIQENWDDDEDEEDDWDLDESPKTPKNKKKEPAAKTAKEPKVKRLAKNKASAVKAKATAKPKKAVEKTPAKPKKALLRRTTPGVKQKTKK
ncbi:UPF0158 family protein [Parachlamydia sp. AcF125]|uniref:UPF0158 family protein n=1 Tax=Parachlamydia sp. AcF125 TaxID=2795736 RepID=UPI001BC9620C|nr:UPF0158 family protein [Parachlamydia sp. AcF125]MBS4167886.1 hypothetical protein [Parachlamydia sp. AcF125]